MLYNWHQCFLWSSCHATTLILMCLFDLCKYSGSESLSAMNYISLCHCTWWPSIHFLMFASCTGVHYNSDLATIFLVVSSFGNVSSSTLSKTCLCSFSLFYDCMSEQWMLSHGGQNQVQVLWPFKSLDLFSHPFGCIISYYGSKFQSGFFKWKAVALEKMLFLKRAINMTSLWYSILTQPQQWFLHTVIIITMTYKEFLILIVQGSISLIDLTFHLIFIFITDWQLWAFWQMGK